MTLIYKGFELSPAVEHLLDPGEWSTRILITKHHAHEVKEKVFSASNTFKDKLEAEDHSIEFGKKIVDGHYKGATIADLL